MNDKMIENLQEQVEKIIVIALVIKGSINIFLGF